LAGDGSRNRRPIGAVASRGTLLELALLASDNRAASALARQPDSKRQFAITRRPGLGSCARRVNRSHRSEGVSR